MVEKNFQIQVKNVTKTLNKTAHKTTTTRQLTISYNDNESMAKMTNKTRECTRINKISSK